MIDLLVRNWGQGEVKFILSKVRECNERKSKVWTVKKN